MKAYRNKFDRTGRASKLGADAEISFKKSIDGFFGSDIKLTGAHNGQFDHIDFHCNMSMDVDVKSIRDPETLWVEFKNVQGNAGWLYGKATHFAFEKKEGFMIVSKGDLIQLVDSLVDKDTHVNSPKACMYKMYSRKKYGRDDLLSKIHPDDLYKIPYILVGKGTMGITSRPVDSGTSSLKEEKEQDPWI
jgi:hypothetical protein